MRMLKMVYEQLWDESLWQELPHTESCASDVLRFCLRPAGVIVQNVIGRYSGYPLAALNLINHPEEASKDLLHVAAVSPCLLDKYTQSLVQRYGDEAGLQSPECRAELMCWSGICCGNTFDVERDHSRTARKARSRFHTHSAALGDLAVWRAGSSGPTMLQEVGDNKDWTCVFKPCYVQSHIKKLS